MLPVRAGLICSWPLNAANEHLCQAAQLRAGPDRPLAGHQERRCRGDVRDTLISLAREYRASAIVDPRQAVLIAQEARAAGVMVTMNSGGSPNGVRQPPRLLTRRIKKTGR